MNHPLKSAQMTLFEKGIKSFQKLTLEKKQANTEKRNSTFNIFVTSEISRKPWKFHVFQ